MMAARRDNDGADRDQPRTALDEQIARLDALRQKMKAKAREKRLPKARPYYLDKD